MASNERPVTQLQHFFRSVPMPCPYVDGRIERKLFTRLAHPDGTALNTLLSQAGFRRSHDILYRPVCPACQACVPVRIRARDLHEGASLRRIRRRNRDLAVEARPAVATAEQFALFARYQASRHGDSDMARMSESDYVAMIEEGGVDCRMLELRDGGGHLAGAVLADRLSDGFSAVYSFFDPDEGPRSLGTDLILRLVDQANHLELPFVYLGYWIAESQKMRYKARFRPLEALVDGTWQVLQVRDDPMAPADRTADRDDVGGLAAS
jgi:arginine-tRNA-protein transferase